jgi:integrase/recombinase XerD
MKLPISINEEEFTALIKNTLKAHQRLAFLLGFGSGLRVSEIIHLEPRDIDLKQRTILVRQGKGSKDRIVPLPKAFKEAMLTLLPIKYTPRSLEIAFKTASKKAGLLESKPGLHFHSLRHGFATHGLQSGIPLNQIQLLLGHSNIATTSIYLKAHPKDALKSYEDYF